MIPAHQFLAACDTSQATTQVCQHDSAGPGAGLRIFVILAIIGIVVLGWLLLRGYQGSASSGRTNPGPGGSGQGGSTERTPPSGAGDEGGTVPTSPASSPGDTP